MKKKYTKMEMKTFNIKMEERIANCNPSVWYDNKTTGCVPMVDPWVDSCLDTKGTNSGIS